MSRSLLTLLALMLVLASGAYAQSCADVDNHGTVNIADAVYMLAEHVGGAPIPVGKGDIDFRQGYNAGDARFLIDFIFNGGPAPGCPPFPPYSLVNTDDTLILPSYIVPVGSGEFVLPIYLFNQAKVSDMVLPMQVNGLGSDIFFDSLQFGSFWSTASYSMMGAKSANGSTGVMAFATILHSYDIAVGINLVGLAFFHYTSSPGGTVSMDTITVGPHTFLNYVYGPSFAIGIPKVVVAAASTYPEMIVQPDSLFYEILVGSPDPSPQQFSIQSSGEPFDWTLTKPSWISVDATSGISGQTVSVTPNATGLSIGVHYGEIIVMSTGAIGPPQKVVVRLKVKQQFESLDANCDGTYNIADVVAQIVYIFGQGTLCNPCTGEWPVKK